MFQVQTTFRAQHCHTRGLSFQMELACNKCDTRERENNLLGYHDKLDRYIGEKKSSETKKQKTTTSNEENAENDSEEDIWY